MAREFVSTAGLVTEMSDLDPRHVCERDERDPRRDDDARSAEMESVPEPALHRPGRYILAFVVHMYLSSRNEK